jgi:hypothetical protein
MSPKAKIKEGILSVVDFIEIDFAKLNEDNYALVEYNLFNKELVRQKIYSGLRRHNKSARDSIKIVTRNYSDDSGNSFFVIKRKK